MATTRPINVNDLWAMQRLGAPSLSPDGAQVVASVTTPDLAANKQASALWLFSTLGGRPRALTQCGDKDGQPQFSPARADGSVLVAFVARREQQGHKDSTPQLYVIAPDGGEARRVCQVPTGVEGFRWAPDGRRIFFAAWVRPGLKGAAAQAKAHKAWEERKESAIATGELLHRFWDHNLPPGCVPHLHVVDVDTGRVQDLFEGTAWELERAEPGADSFDVSPDGQRVVFAHDPAAEKQIIAKRQLVEMALAGRRAQVLAGHAEWDFNAPTYSPDGSQVAFIACHIERRHTMPTQLAVAQRAPRRWQVVAADWDREVQAPLRWLPGGQALLLPAEDQGRRHLWRLDLATGQARVQVRGGTVQAYSQAGDTVVVLADAALHPARLTAHALAAPDTAGRRIERSNDALLKRLDLGRCEERWFTGAQGDKVQLWLFYPPGHKPGGAKRWPLLQVIHGGPHTAPGDGWHWRWNNPAFAAQGYVVAAVNYHGSSSFGFAFKDAITQRWGELELQDIERATTHLLKTEPTLDPQRVYAAGGSYGGYLVAWMNAHAKPGRYQAYVCHAGCYDWVGMAAADSVDWLPRELGAAYWDDMARVHSQSPHAFAGRMRTPTLVVHGALDYRVPDAQGLAYYNTLKARGVDARLVWFPDENHWVLKPRNSALWYAEFFAWLKGHGGHGPAKRPRAG
jgi:dipeptidyl aminopeptidase/acylaminoacyl peptidase